MMRMDSLHVVMVAVPWRVSSVKKSIRALERSTLCPGTVWILQQDAHREPIDDQLSSKRFRLRTIRLHRNDGPGIRWKFIEATLPKGSTVAVLDDDFVVERDYLQKSVLPILDGQCDATCWNGFDRKLGHVWVTSRLQSPKLMWVAGGGTMTLDTSYLAGLSDNAMSAEYLDRLGAPDDAWASSVIRANGGKILRPAGSGPLSSTGAQTESRALRWSSPQAFRMTLALWGMELTGWVPVDRRPAPA